MSSGITTLFRYLPERFTRILANIPEIMAKDATEIRLRAGSVFTLTVCGKSVAFNKQGHPSPISGGVRCTVQDIDDCVSLLVGHSIYSFEETIKKGYIPLKGGGRAGICGDAVSGAGGILTFSQITSVNLRIHKLYRSFASPLIDRYRRDGLDGALIYSPPGLGKTSFLRSAAVLISGMGDALEYRTAIVDERSEMFMPEMAGGLLDIISGCKKSEGIELVTRSMAPDVIICDELAESDCEPLINAQNSGVSLLASAHGGSFESLMQRPFIKRMFECGLFVYVVQISDGFKVNVERV